MRTIIRYLDKLSGFVPLTDEQEKKDNINDIFMTTVHWMPAITAMYDYQYKMTNDHLAAKIRTVDALDEIDRRNGTN